MSTPIYKPEVFINSDLNDAKSIILTDEGDVNTEIRWRMETPWLLDIIKKNIKTDDLIIDYGCGVGRISKELVGYGCKVIGVDLSITMRQHATNMVGSDNFVALAPSLLDRFIDIGAKADVVLAVWVLQHCFDLEAEVKRIFLSMKDDAVLFVVDMQHRAVPTDKGWIDDGKTVKDTLLERFSILEEYPFSPPNCPSNLKDSAWIAVFKKIN